MCINHCLCAKVFLKGPSAESWNLSDSPAGPDETQSVLHAHMQINE